MKKAQFQKSAKPLSLQVGEIAFTTAPRKMSTGSVGYSLADKITLVIDGEPVLFQVGINVTACGSKNWQD
jgi:hypothetical protein